MISYYFIVFWFNYYCRLRCLIHHSKESKFAAGIWWWWQCQEQLDALTAEKSQASENQLRGSKVNAETCGNTMLHFNSSEMGNVAQRYWLFMRSSTASTASAALARVVELENELQKAEQLQLELEETQETLSYPFLSMAHQFWRIWSHRFRQTLVPSGAITEVIAECEDAWWIIRIS